MFVRRVNFLLVSTSLSVLWSAGAYADPVKATSKARSSALLQQPGASRHSPFKVRKKRPAGDDEVVIVTGTRESNRKARNSIAPIDVITARQLQQTGETDPSRALTRVMPSISMSSYGNDTSAFNSTIRMRGLNPNEVLILVDGQRRHQTSLMSYDTGPEQGATPTDIDTIPASMIDHIEVLRDGAAAIMVLTQLQVLLILFLKGFP